MYSKYMKSYALKRDQEQTIKMTYKGQEITPNQFIEGTHNLFTLTNWFKWNDKWFTVPPNNEAHGTDTDTFIKWLAQWELR